MEKTGDCEQKKLISELTQGRELVKQLQIHLNPSSPAELRELLVQKILCSFTKALCLLKGSESDGEQQPTATGPINDGADDSPRSISGSPRSENSERADVSKKRKMLPKWSEQVRISTGTGLEGPLEDGYSWRKYGQKEILGAKYPRGYYRCTHRHGHGCLATKQVQRTDEDPTVFDVTYRGQHTCLQSSRRNMTSPLPEKPQPQPQSQQQILLNFRTGLRVKTENLDCQDMNSSPFSFPSASVEGAKPENPMFSPSALDNNFMGSFSPPFISPATSESNYFSVSPFQMNSFSGPNLRGSKSDLTEMISGTTSTSNSPLLELDFALDPADFDPNFPFDTPGFFS